MNRLLAVLFVFLTLAAFGLSVHAAENPTLVGTFNRGFSYRLKMNGAYAWLINLPDELDIVDIRTRPARSS